MNSTLQAAVIALGLFALFGLFALIEALGDRRKRRRMEDAERARTVGVIVDYAEERHRHSHRHGQVRSTRYVTIYYPIVHFQVDGTEYKLKSTSFVPREEYRESQAVDLLYDPNNPTHFHLDRGDVEDRSTRGTTILSKQTP